MKRRIFTKLGMINRYVETFFYYMKDMKYCLYCVTLVKLGKICLRLVRNRV